MKRLVVLSLLVVALSAFAQTPKGWDDAYRQVAELMLAGKGPEAIALLERVVTQAPDFIPARYELGSAHAHWAVELALQDPPAADERRRHLELAATHFRRVAERDSEYRPLAALRLMSLYGDEDDLNQPQEAIPFARLYVELSPSSASGHVQLARMLELTGDTEAGTAALLAARGPVRDDDERALLATSIIAHLGLAPAVPADDVRTLLDYAQPVVDAAIAREPENRRILLTKAAALMLRAERVETDPKVRKALLEESDRLFDRFRDMGD